jgi:hypothetical protein
LVSAAQASTSRGRRISASSSAAKVMMVDMMNRTARRGLACALSLYCSTAEPARGSHCNTL